jgi:hypothetical protein
MVVIVNGGHHGWYIMHILGPEVKQCLGELTAMRDDLKGREQLTEAEAEVLKRARESIIGQAEVVESVILWLVEFYSEGESPSFRLALYNRQHLIYTSRGDFPRTAGFRGVEIHCHQPIVDTFQCLFWTLAFESTSFVSQEGLKSFVGCVNFVSGPFLTC